MNQFVQLLESRQLLSASVNLTIDEAKVGLDVRGIIADAKDARSTLAGDAKAVAVQLKQLKLKNAPLGKALQSAIAVGRNKIAYDVWKIVSTGASGGRAVFHDWFRISFLDGGNATALASDQTKLAADVKNLATVEQPLIDKIRADITSTETNVKNAIQTIVDANQNDSALTTHWTALQNATDASQKTLSDDFSQLTLDVDQLVADA